MLDQEVYGFGTEECRAVFSMVPILRDFVSLDMLFTGYSSHSVQDYISS
jgi:hypothetical protein